MMKHTSAKFLAALLTILSLSGSWCAPSRTDDVIQEATELTLDKRPKYMDTRRDLDIIKDLVMLSIRELVHEDSLSPAILPEEDQVEPVKKRARYMGICMRKQFNSLIPFPCLRNGR